MSYNFPASPTPGQEYTPPVGGQTYIWSPPRWLVKGIPPAGGGGGTGGIDEAPVDGQQYGREDASWTVVEPPASDWSEITGKPPTFPPTVPIAWTNISGKPSTYPPTLPIAQSDVTGLVAGQAAQDTAIAGKVSTSAYTPADVLAKLITVDGTGSALDADLLDGQNGTYYLARANHTGTQAQSTVTGLVAEIDSQTNWNAAQDTQLSNLVAVNDAQQNDINAKANIASPTFTGDPKAPTPTAGDNDTSIATTAFVQSAVSSGGKAQPAAYDYKFSTATTSAGIANGEVRFNNAAFNSVTHIYLSENSPTGQAYGSSLYVLTQAPANPTGRSWLFETNGNPDKWAKFKIVSVAPYAGYLFDCTVIFEGGASMFAAADALVAEMWPSEASPATAADFWTNAAGVYLNPNAVWAAAVQVDLGNITGNVALNLATGINFKAAMTGNIVFNTVTNAKKGQSGIIELTHSGGARTATYTAAAFEAAGGTLTLSTAASARDYISYYVADNGKVALLVSGKGMA